LGPCRFVAVFIEHETEAFFNDLSTKSKKKALKKKKSLLNRNHHHNDNNEIRNPIINEEGIEIDYDMQQNDQEEDEDEDEEDEDGDEKVMWEYSAVISEMLHGGGGNVPRVFGAADPTIEARLWNDLVKALEMVAQANEIASEMLVKVEFCAEVATTLSPDFDHSQVAPPHLYTRLLFPHPFFFSILFHAW
jgi:hypothetical protein